MRVVLNNAHARQKMDRAQLRCCPYPVAMLYYKQCFTRSGNSDHHHRRFFLLLHKKKERNKTNNNQVDGARLRHPSIKFTRARARAYVPSSSLSSAESFQLIARVSIDTLRGSLLARHQVFFCIVITRERSVRPPLM